MIEQPSDRRYEGSHASDARLLLFQDADKRFEAHLVSWDTESSTTPLTPHLCSRPPYTCGNRQIAPERNPRQGHNDADKQADFTSRRATAHILHQRNSDSRPCRLSTRKTVSNLVGPRSYPACCVRESFAARLYAILSNPSDGRRPPSPQSAQSPTCVAFVLRFLVRETSFAGIGLVMIVSAHLQAAIVDHEHM